MAPDGSAVYCTLVLTDHYLPGAVVLAHSLRDNGTKAKLVALYTPDTLQHATVNELRTVYDEIIPVQTATNHTPANLWLMDRPDLVSTFTKIELWRQTQFTRIVYIDCDVVALRAPDELLTLELDADFAAAPDIGWPDCFNSGVMVLRPNMQDYFALKALAERGISFDGADQGLLNMHFRNWERLSFTYNCTPSSSYQYIPAYKHFQSTISLIHFIGARKPWNMPRQVTPAESPYNQLLGRWWAIYDRHYRPVAIVSPHAVDSQSARPQSHPRAYPQISVIEPPRVLISHPSEDQTVATFHGQAPESQHGMTQEVHSPSALPLVSHSSHSYHQPQSQQTPHEEVPHETGSSSRVETSHLQPVDTILEEHRSNQAEPFHQPTLTQSLNTVPGPLPAPVPIRSAVPQYVRGEEHVSAYIPPRSDQPAFTLQTEQLRHQDTSFPPAPVQSSVQSSVPIEVPFHQQPAQVFSEQEQQTPAPALPQADIDTFEAPKAEWDAAREPPPVNSKPEGIALSMKTYTMSEDKQLFQPPTKYPEAPKNMWYQVPAKKPEPAKVTQLFPWESHAPKPTRIFLEDQPSTVSTTSIESPSASSREEYRPSTGSWTSWATEEPSTASWDSYSRANAWDEVPAIQKYIQSIQQPRKGNIQVLSGGPSPGNEPAGGQAFGPGARSMRITDFPTEIERPSLPVTPAPIRRYSGPDSGGDPTDEQLPIAQGVPNQDDWNPLARLEELCRRQSEVLENPDFLLHEREREHG